MLHNFYDFPSHQRHMHLRTSPDPFTLTCIFPESNMTSILFKPHTLKFFGALGLHGRDPQQLGSHCWWSVAREGVLFQRHRGEIGGNPKALKAAWRLLRLILYPSQRKQKPPAEPHCAAITAAELRGWRDARMTECLLGTTDFVFTNVCPLKCVSEHKCRWKWLY